MFQNNNICTRAEPHQHTRLVRDLPGPLLFLPAPLLLLDEEAGPGIDGLGHFGRRCALHGEQRTAR